MSNNQIAIYEIINELDNSVNKNDTRDTSATDDVSAISMWLREFKHNQNTSESYRLCAERFYLWVRSRNKTLKDVNREDTQDYQEFLANPTPEAVWCGKKCYRSNPKWKPFVKGLAISSIRLQLQILTGLYNYLIDIGYLGRNPLRLMRIKPKVVDKGIERYLTHEEIGYIFDYIYSLPEDSPHLQFYKERLLWIFSLLYFTGCRRAEVLRATMKDFIYRRNQWWLKVIGKGNKYGEIPTTQGLMSALIRYRVFLGLSDYPTPDDDIALIVSEKKTKDGKYRGIQFKAFHDLITDICHKVAASIDTTDSAAAYKLRHVSAHWLRHTSATHQVDAGIDIRIVKENLRHANIETTMRYQHTENDNRHRETTEKFKF